MNKTKLMLAAVALCVGVVACAKHDANAITGSNTTTGVTLSNDPSSYTIAKGADNAVTFAPVATLVPQNVAIANGTQNMVYTFSDPAVAEINGDGNLQGDQVGTTTLTVTYHDVDHGFATTTLAIPVTVTAAP